MDYYGFLILTIIITFGAQIYLNSQYKRCLKVSSHKKNTGEEVARKILDANGLGDVKVERGNGELSDHYDPRSKVVRLSPDIFEESSIASVAVAAHECGHAIQHKNHYFFLTVRNSIVPLVRFSSYAGYIAIMLGVIFGSLGLLWLGIIFEVVILLFQLITLPVEFNASHRGMKQLLELHLIEDDEVGNGRRMLQAAALTYVASVATSLLQVLRLLMMFRRRD